ncbi:MAG: glycosyltransferase family 4 protein [Chloroflexi bacterium]|nr:glycosyltransferase family 4 protein [Chloroflexota bacterium]MBA3740463.1 glycosyltransferase family 4 protein [Chloroflexota bacterium]
MSRVAIVVHAVYPGDPRIRRQSDALLEEGHEVDIICLRQPGEAFEEADGALRIVRMPLNRGFIGFAGHIAEYAAFSAMVAWRLAREHRTRRYDLVQVATVPDFLVFAALPEKLGGVPLLLDLHEDMPEFFRDRFASPLLRPLLPMVTAATRASAAVADAIITVHEPLRLLSIARGVDPERISVVMNSADGRLFDPSRHERRGFMADGTLRLIHHSNFQRIYGLDVAIEGLARIRSDLPWRLDVYGDGPWRPQIEAAVERTGTGDRVTLHGRVAMDDLPGLLAGSDIGLVPSVAEPYMAYSLSTKLLEYAAMGVPTIATDLATFRHHFTDAALCFVPGGDRDVLARAVEALVHDPTRTVAMGLEAQRQAAAYDWEHQRRRYLEIVDRLVTEGAAG